MPAVPTDPDWEFDHLDPLLAPHLNEVFAAIRERCPVVRTERHGGYWAVMSYDAVRAVFGDAPTYSSTEGVIFPSLIAAGTPQPPLEVDPPEHTPYRKLIQKYFTRHAVAGYEDVFRELTRQRIGELIAAGEADLIPALAEHLPPIGIAMVLGLPPEAGKKFVQWTGQMFEALASDDHATLASLNEVFSRYLSENIERQRNLGADTLTTAIAAAQIDGQPMPLDVQVGMIFLLVMAGHETTVISTATMLYLMAAVDGLKQRLIDDPGLIPAMIDESLRLETPGIVLSRVTRRDTTLAGQPMSAGDRICMVMNSANRDPSVFDHPDEFRCPRKDNPHLSFGYGIHRCVGEHLARLQMRVVAEEVLRLMPGYRLAEGYHPVWEARGMMRRLATLPAIIGG